MVIIEYCDMMSTINRKQYYIDDLKPEYNFCLIAVSSLGRITREETKLELRNTRLNKQFAKYNTLGEFIINSIDKRLDESRLKITKLYIEFNRIKQL
jgi:hypothetical protein